MSELTTLPEIAVVERDGEPRARDVDIADRLGFERPRDVRKLIERHRREIEAFGVCATVAQTSGPKGGRPATEYLLNEEQSLLIASISDAPNAPAVRSMLIRTFVAWRRGHLDVAKPDMKAIGGTVKGIVAKAMREQLPALVHDEVVAALSEMKATPALDFGGTVSAYQVIESAGIPVSDRQRGTAQMVTKRLIAFCADRQIACFRTPAEVNPSRPFRFPQPIASLWLLGETRGLELVRGQVDRMKARKAAKGMKTGQGALRLVP